MTKSILILLLSILGAVGCLPQQPTSVYARDDLKPLVRAAVDRLNAAAGLGLYVSSDPDADIVVQRGSCPTATGGCTLWRKIAGEPITKPTIVIVEDLEVVMIHELGHALRLDGAHADEGIFHDPPTHDLITDGDLRFLCGPADCAHWSPESSDGVDRPVEQ